MHTESEVSNAIRVEFAGRAFRVSTADETDLIARKIQEGSYEAPLPMVLAAAVSRTSGLFLDVGANNGVYSLIASGARQGVRIVAFEPFPPVLELLRENIRLNGLEDRISVVEIALSDEPGMFPIYLPDQAHGLVETSASLQKDFIAGSESAMMVQTRRLDDVPLDAAVSVIKVDIEGFELEFLRGAEATIARDRPFIFAEMLGAAAHKFAEITRRLSDLGYLAFRLRPDAAILAHWIVFDHQAWNYALVPNEKVALFRAICVEHGLEMLAPA